MHFFVKILVLCFAQYQNLFYICIVIRTKICLLSIKPTMKETLNVNIGGVAFTIDEDACRTLKSYLKKIEVRLPYDDKETLQDIERRVAELLCEKISSPQRVVTMAEVKEAMATLGEPDTFGTSHTAESESEEQTSTSETHRRLYRSRTNRSLAGVCAAIAAYFGLDVTLVRLATLLLIIFGGLSIWVYIILWIIIPEEPARPININR